MTGIRTHTLLLKTPELGLIDMSVVVDRFATTRHGIMTVYVFLCQGPRQVNNNNNTNENPVLICKFVLHFGSKTTSDSY